MSILVIAEHDNASLNGATLNTVTAAQQIGGDIDLLIAGNGCAEAAQAAAQVAGVNRVLLADNASLEGQLAENVANLVVSLAGNYTHVLTAATTFGKNFMPRAAALLDMSQISEISEVISADTFVRPVYAGNAMAKVQSSDSIKLITVRTTKFDAAAETGGSAAVEAVDVAADSGLSRFVGLAASESERVELTSASIVISGGRGMQNGENFHMLDSIADKLGAAVGASRAAVDAGFVPNDYQVGQTGKVIAPDLYIAVGISGAIQHLAGMKDSKTIVAINKDSEAPIFQVADYGLVADLFEAVPELDKAL
ncbi:MAG: electron transfer flavoprotein subunit alpha/FixB family protein [Oceanospirillaceae bacterium]|jgi:electron transfer flavoprotein alpha subunit|nr:electron transfer flavoprotein subunit alpha/FixB family protein [Oceanospirillaceae bacterium]MBT7330284.1 electron transfer flavoprotein subunit alpha/FixB family protein [Oceanospirillaceae bacterium]